MLQNLMLVTQNRSIYTMQTTFPLQNNKFMQILLGRLSLSRTLMWSVSNSDISTKFRTSILSISCDNGPPYSDIRMSEEFKHNTEGLYLTRGHTGNEKCGSPHNITFLLGILPLTL